MHEVSRASTYRLVVEGPDERVAVAIFCGGYWGLGLDDRVDAADWDAVSCAAN